MARRERPGFVNVDELQEQIDLETVLDYFGVQAELKRVGCEVRTACFLNCGKEHPTGDRSLAIQVDGVKRWKCHEYGCGRSGNLVGLCDLLKPGIHMEGKPRGQRFKEIAADLQAMAGGARQPSLTAPGNEQSTTPPPREDEQKRNLPLAQSDKEAARALVNLDQKFLVLPDEAMNKHAASYMRHRPYLTPEICRKWRCGYLPHDTGGDKSGGTMRGKFVYGMQSEDGEILTWFGRDPEYEKKRSNWETAGRPADKEPRKHHFVKGFHRGLELYGQQRSRLDEPGYRETIQETGIIVVEGPNDVIALDAIGVPAVGLCGNHVTKQQVAKLSRWAQELSDGTVTLLLDCDPEGENGARQSAYELAQHIRVRVAWSPAMFDGTFRGRQPESLADDEWKVIRDSLTR